MNVWAITMVRDELDVLPYTLAHLAAEGVDYMIVADNMSTDGTWEWLEQATYPDMTLYPIRDTEVAYYQSQKMSRLYRQAVNYGADWVLPFDADELWYSPEGTLKEVFERASAEVLEVGINTYHPTSQDPPSEVNPFLRICYRELRMSIMAKIAVRAMPDDIVIENGNHQVHTDRPLDVVRAPMEIGHFPWRSYEQFERKTRNGAEAHAAAVDRTALPLDQGEHWRYNAKVLAEQGPAGLRKLYDAQIFDPACPLARDPVPWRGVK